MVAGSFKTGSTGCQAAVQSLEETAVTAGVAGDRRIVPELGDPQQHDVVVAIEPDLVHLLDVAGLLALGPQALARAAVVHGVAACPPCAQRLAVHPGEHQHVAAGASCAMTGTSPWRPT
jgi:hypothetical protein